MVRSWTGDRNGKYEQIHPLAYFFLGIGRTKTTKTTPEVVTSSGTKNKIEPNAGLEPATVGLRVQRSTD